MATSGRSDNLAPAWVEHVHALAARIRETACGAMRAALDEGRIDRVADPVSQGAGDVTFGLDVGAEQAILDWAQHVAREEPLSFLTEDAGWRHLGPGPDGTATDLPGFDHGGPRLCIDPVDGTRNLMHDMRSAWSVIALAPAGSAEPRMSDVTYGLVSELPDSRAARFRTLEAHRGAGCTITDSALEGPAGEPVPLHTDADDRVDQGYFPFFHYAPELRPAIAAIAARFFQRIEREEDAETRSCYDDHYICNAGQLVLLALGTYRMIVDARQHVAMERGITSVTTRPYDIAGALLCAREAGCVVRAVDGAELDFPLDAVTPIGFAGWTNVQTAERLGPHLSAALSR